MCTQYSPTYTLSPPPPPSNGTKPQAGPITPSCSLIL
jgi:hypothetical protein